MKYSSLSYGVDHGGYFATNTEGPQRLWSLVPLQQLQVRDFYGSMDFS